jgi:hypothetical protein
VQISSGAPIKSISLSRPYRLSTKLAEALESSSPGDAKMWAEKANLHAARELLRGTKDEEDWRSAAA